MASPRKRAREADEEEEGLGVSLLSALREADAVRHSHLAFGSTPLARCFALVHHDAAALRALVAELGRWC